MKGNSYSSSEDDGDFNANDSDEEDYDFPNEDESIIPQLIDQKEKPNEKTTVDDETPSKSDKTIFDLADEIDSDSEDFQIKSGSNSDAYSSENALDTIDNNDTKKEKIEFKSDQILIKENANNTNIISNTKESNSESDNNDFEETFKSSSIEYSETETEFSDIEKLKNKLKSKQNGSTKDIDELKALFSTIITLIPPYKNASEALNNFINDDQKAKKITEVATQMLFLGKFNVYSCDIEQMKKELEFLQKNV